MSDDPTMRGAEPMTPAWRALGWTALAFGAALLADGWAYGALRDARVYERDWGRLLRVIGFLGTWIALAVAVWLHESADVAQRVLAKRRAWMLFIAPAAGGLVAELLKLVFRRERPNAHDGEWFFRAFSDRPWNNAGLALPSSHALVAFAGAAMFARVFPRARWVGYTLAAGCALTRVMAHAHFLSDVTMAAGLGWVVAYLLDRRWPVQTGRTA